MKHISYLIIVLGLLASCTGKKSANANKIEFDSIVVNEQIKLLPDTPDSIPYAALSVHYVYPKSFREKADLKRLQQLFNEAVLGSADGTPQEAVNKCVANYSEIYRTENTADFLQDKKEFPEGDISYKYMHSDATKNTIEYVNHSLLSFSVMTDVYKGGAHGVYIQTNTNINLNTLQTIKESDIFVAGYKKPLAEIIKQKLLEFAKEAFADYNHSNLKDFFFKFDSISPNDNFLMTEKGLSYVYNVYEIAPYASGMFTVEIPYGELSALLKPDVLTEIFPETEIAATEPKSVENPRANALSETQFAFIDKSGFYFYNTATSEKIPFEAEKDTVFNFTFDDMGKRFFYTVERDGSLWLKKADLNAATITPEWVGDWKLKKDECITETYGQVSELKYNDNKLLIRHTFNWEMYGFENFSVYNLTANKLDRYDSESRKDTDYQILWSFDKNEENSNDDFTTENEQLYYKGVCLSDKMKLKALCENPGCAIETEYFDQKISPDGKKVLFSAAIEMGDLAHGPFCIASIDGKYQKPLKNTDVGQGLTPIWLRNNIIIYADTEENLFWLDIDNSKMEKITEQVLQYKRK